MTTVAAVLPMWLSPVAEGLSRAGMEVHHLWPGEPGSEYAHVHSVAGIDLLKALRATGADPLLEELFRELPANASRTAMLFEGIVQREPHVILCSYTADPAGKAALAAGKFLGVPAVHLEHACMSLRAEDAWFLRQSPGDLVLAGGARDAAWWKRCNPDARVEVTGLPQWDWTYGRQPRQQPGVPTIVYLAESGSNAAQTPLVWQHRELPQRSWAAFLAAMPRLRRPTTVIIKVRSGESPDLCDRWLREARAAELYATLTDTHLANVLPYADLVVGQQSNGLLEAVSCGVKGVSISRPGVELAEELPTISGLADDLDVRLAQTIEEQLEGSEYAPARLREIAEHYNIGVRDGRSMARVAEAVLGVAGAKAPAEERALVLA